MISRSDVFEMHKLWNQGFSKRQIARQLQLDRETVAKYLVNPDPAIKTRITRKSKLDPYRTMVEKIVDQYTGVKAPVVLQRLINEGFDGEITIVRNLLRELRGQMTSREPFIRFETGPGEQIQVDWGHFGNLSYGSTRRKLYALAVLEGHSRMLYVHFSHSQQQSSLHQGLLDAFKYFGGFPREIVVDNMLTAVTERVGTVIRFNDAFLDFLRRFSITPRACTIRAPYEKGKVENAIKYLRQNFWPLREFADLTDVQNQVQHWLDSIANIRKHHSTGEAPVKRLQGLQPLPQVLPDCRHICSLLVHKDFGIRFDVNVYTVPPWAIGKHITLKADNQKVSIYLKEKLIACHNRCWDRKQRIESPTHLEQVKKIKKRLLQDRQVLVFLSLGEIALHFLEKITDSSLPIRKNIAGLLELQDEYGESSLLYGMGKAMEKKLYGADYVRNILYQEMTPVNQHLPVRLKQEDLNEIRLTTPPLAEYDAVAVKRRNNHAK
jgi:transposase